MGNPSPNCIRYGWFWWMWLETKFKGGLNLDLTLLHGLEALIHSNKLGSKWNHLFNTRSMYMEFEFGLNLDCVDMQICWLQIAFELRTICINFVSRALSLQVLFNSRRLFLASCIQYFGCGFEVVLHHMCKAIYTSGPQHSLEMPGGGSKIRSGSVSLSDTTTTRLSKR